ncbi:hypothetical protein EGW08_016660 [Elysia chlorotica]|uniref:Uncharacterized protein n=1 Tax=Elysia chlorotica TaxID=188477 RepID=A0A3S1HAT2_ELYCH|nr:hypothetical protein EGW08_016660 [Elysia chlorotica]
MASRKDMIGDALNSAINSNLGNIVHEDRLLALIDDFLMGEEEEEEPDSAEQLPEESLGETEDYYIKGLLDCHGVADSQMLQQKRASRRTERVRKRRTYMLMGNGNPVCRPAFLFLLWVPGYHRTGLKLLPSHWTKKKVWTQFKEASEKTGWRVLSVSTFKKTWLRYVPFIVVARPMTDLCNICQSNNSLILRSANTGDPSKLRLLEEKVQHIQKVNKERELYNSYVQAFKRQVLETSIDGLVQSAPCSRNMSMMYAFDFAQQVHLQVPLCSLGPFIF